MANHISLGEGAPVLAADVGGTVTKVSVVDGTGRVSPPVRIRTPSGTSDTPRDILDAISATASNIPGADRVAAAGVALPGIFDEERGIGIWSENLDWHDVDFRSLAPERLQLPSTVSHDVRAAALAELRLGAATGLRDAAVITLGTGIAAAVIVDGTPRVSGGYAGEIGHAVVDPTGEPCLCGNRGCLEATASAAAIARRYGDASGTPVAGARDVLERAQSGNPTAQRIWSSAIDALALGISHLSAVIAPQAIVIGGGLSEAGDALFVPLQERLNERFRLRPTPLLRAFLGEDAGVIGAAVGAREGDLRGVEQAGGPHG